MAVKSIPDGYHTVTPYLVDPFGHVWTIATHKEDVSKDEMARRFQEAMSKQGGG